jgi:antirestriction protein ArdC
MNDIYQTITDKIITELEVGTVPWVRPWSGEADPFPRNALSQRPYRGINTVVLGMEAHCRGYASNQWLTFKQAQQLGGHVRKGERASTIIYYEARMMEKNDADLVAEGDEADKRFVPLLKLFSVFNVDQVEGLPESYQDRPVHEADWDASATAEQIMECSGAAIRHQGFKAFYSPTNDLIYLPGKATFADAAAYYSTALHELCHWTGSSTRLGRKLGRRFGESAYAMEELIAELGAAFLSAHCRLDGQLQHASYISSWLEVLQRDKRAVFVAAAQAQKAADYLLAQAGLLAPEVVLPLREAA